MKSLSSVFKNLLSLSCIFFFVSNFISNTSCFFEKFIKYSSLVEISSTKPTSKAFVPSHISPVATLEIFSSGLNFETCSLKRS